MSWGEHGSVCTPVWARPVPDKTLLPLQALALPVCLWQGSDPRSHPSLRSGASAAVPAEAEGRRECAGGSGSWEGARRSCDEEQAAAVCGLLGSSARRCHLFSFRKPRWLCSVFPPPGLALKTLQRSWSQVLPDQPFQSSGDAQSHSLLCCRAVSIRLRVEGWEPGQEGAWCHCSRLDLSEAATLPLLGTVNVAWAGLWVTELVAPQGLGGAGLCHSLHSSGLLCAALAGELKKDEL